MDLFELLKGDNFFAVFLRENVKTITGGLMGTGEMQKYPNETEAQYKDRMLKSAASAIISFKHSAKTIKGVDGNDTTASIKSGAYYATLYSLFTVTLFVASSFYGFYLLFKKVKK